MKCRQCGSMMSTERRLYHYTACGLPNVWLEGLDVNVCLSCGDASVAIPNIEGLHDLLAQCLVTKRSHLTGDEVRFLRSHVGWSGQDFARMLRVNPSTVSRWESGRQMMGSSAETAVRLLCVAFPKIQDYEAHDNGGESAEQAAASHRLMADLMRILPEVDDSMASKDIRPTRVHGQWTAERECSSHL